MTCIS